MKYLSDQDDRLVGRGWILFLLIAVGMAEPMELSAADEPYTLAQLRVERKKMAARRRRIIFNNDGDDIAGARPASGKIRSREEAALATTPEGLLSIRTTALLGTQVDSIFYHSTYGMRIFLEDGPFKEIYAYPDTTPLPESEGSDGGGGLAVRNCRRLIKKHGKDALEVMVDFCRQHDLEIFYSNRMNDVHDYYFPEMLSYIKVRHPEYTIGHEPARSPEETLKLLRAGRKTNTGLNFELKIIRDLTVAAMRQICRNYDIDGIELDYFRWASLFPEVGPPQIELLNDMTRELRQMTEEEGLRRGRPILLAARVLNDPARSLQMGIDIERWLKEGRIDIVMPLHFIWHQGPLKAFIDMAHNYGAPAYPCVRRVESQVSWPMCRGEALSRFAEGADGITTFNRFDPTHRLWRELGDPKVLQDLDRTYTCSPYVGTLVTEKGTEGSQIMMIGEDLSRAGRRGSIRLRIQTRGLTLAHNLQVELNDQRLDLVRASPIVTDVPEDILLTFSPDPALFARPDNYITAQVKPGAGSVRLTDLRLDVFSEKGRSDQE